MATQKTTPGAKAPGSDSSTFGKGGSSFGSNSGASADLGTELPGESGLGSGTGGYGSDAFGTTAAGGDAFGTRATGNSGDSGGQGQTSQLPSVAGVIGQVKQQASSRVNEQKARAAEGLGSVASAIKSASEQLRTENQTLATYADKAVDQIQLFADRMRDKEPEEMVRDAERFARRNPAAFVGGAFVLGLALARFLKSSGDTGANRRGLTHYDSDFGGGNDTQPSYGGTGQGGYGRSSGFAKVDDLAQSGGLSTDPSPGITS